MNLKNDNVKGINISCDNLVDTIVKTIYLKPEYKQDEIKVKYGNFLKTILIYFLICSNPKLS